MISLYDVLEAANGQLYGAPDAQLFNDFCFDSRHAAESNLYAALKTMGGDGQREMREAVERGASGILCMHPPEFEVEGVSVILTRDPQTALIKWAANRLNKLGTQVVGVTGAVGKSITVRAIDHVLSLHYKVQSSAGDLPGRFALPLTVAKLTPENQIVVLELGVTEPGEMSSLIKATQPHVAVVTAVGTECAGGFDTPDRFAHETSALVEHLPADGLAVLNYDDDVARAMNSRTHAKTITVGMETYGADLTAYNILVGTDGTGFDVHAGRNRYVGRWTPLLGRHQLYAILSALAVGMHYGIDPLDALKTLTAIEPLSGHMHPFQGINGALVVDDSCSATPLSTLAALDWLDSVSKSDRRAIFVMGDLDSSGEQPARAHRRIGQRAAAFVEKFVTEGADAAHAGRAAVDHGLDERQVHITYNIGDAARLLTADAALTADDIVLVKGGRSARMEQLTAALLATPDDAARLPRGDELPQVPALSQQRVSTWIEIDTAALADNVRALKTLIGESVGLFAVIKADAYGHGAPAVARTALLNGAEYLCVSSMEEAMALRDAGIDAPVLVLSYTPPQAVGQALRHNITTTLYDLDVARAYDRAAHAYGGVLSVHVKIDTGMGRLGVLAADSSAFFRQLEPLTHLAIEGVFTHFSVADEDADYTAEQARIFKGIVDALRETGWRFKYAHAANSAGMLLSKDYHFDAVRVGLALYGLSPSELVPLPDGIKPVMSWKTVVAQVKTLPPGHVIGYGNTYFTEREQRVAIITIGYAHGFRRAPQHWGHVLVHGQPAPILGRVSMEKTTIDVSHIPDVQIGDEVVVIGQQGDAVLSADDAARRLGTSSYEIVCAALARVPRR